MERSGDERSAVVYVCVFGTFTNTLIKRQLHKCAFDWEVEESHTCAKNFNLARKSAFFQFKWFQYRSINRNAMCQCACIWIVNHSTEGGFDKSLPEPTFQWWFSVPNSRVQSNTWRTSLHRWDNYMYAKRINATCQWIWIDFEFKTHSQTLPQHTVSHKLEKSMRLSTSWYLFLLLQ